MRNILIIIVIISLLAIGGYVYHQSQQMPQSVLRDGESESGEKITVDGYSGEVVAGETTPYLVFNKGDYDKAQTSGKVILLNFYANWCPICRAEASELEMGFNELNVENVVAFRVNYKDSETDKDEKSLAEQFQIPYQHTKVILKNGQEVYRETVKWDKGDLVSIIEQYADQ